jgi:GPH family glycoside/pentoside/hexuronide:cation symporter
MAVPMLFVWKRLAVKFGVKTTLMTATMALFLLLVPLFYVNDFSSTLLASLLVGAVLSGFILLADIVMADIIDEDEVKTGTRREGMFFGSAAFINRFAIALEAISMSTIFMIGGYTPYVFTQTQMFKSGLRFLIAGCPMIALALAFSIIILYPLAGEKLAALRVSLAEIHDRRSRECKNE